MAVDRVHHGNRVGKGNFDFGKEVFHVDLLEDFLTFNFPDIDFTVEATTDQNRPLGLLGDVAIGTGFYEIAGIADIGMLLL